MAEPTDDAIDRVRVVRRRISESVGHDPEALVKHYQEMEKKHESRMLRDPSRRPAAPRT